jgi:hypothetical protein
MEPIEKPLTGYPAERDALNQAYCISTGKRNAQEIGDAFLKGVEWQKRRQTAPRTIHNPDGWSLDGDTIKASRADDYLPLFRVEPLTDASYVNLALAAPAMLAALKELHEWCHDNVAYFGLDVGTADGDEGSKVVDAAAQAAINLAAGR